MRVFIVQQLHGQSGDYAKMLSIAPIQSQQINNVNFSGSNSHTSELCLKANNDLLIAHIDFVLQGYESRQRNRGWQRPQLVTADSSGSSAALVRQRAATRPSAGAGSRPAKRSRRRELEERQADSSRWMEAATELTARTVRWCFSGRQLRPGTASLQIPLAYIT